MRLLKWNDRNVDWDEYVRILRDKVKVIESDRYGSRSGPMINKVECITNLIKRANDECMKRAWSRGIRKVYDDDQ